MAETATAGRDAQDVQTMASHSGIAEFILRAIGAILQLASTWAVVHALAPEAAGVYFRGFVIACGLGALLRSKYELYMAHYILGMRSKATGISNGALLFLLGRRVLLRASLVCGALLVVTTDIDIQAPRFQPVLETYLPFILAIPFVSLSTFLGEALRAGHRSLFGMMVAAFALNLSILLVVALAPPDAPLSVYTWAFLGGSIASAALATLLAWRAFPMCAAAKRPIVREVLEAVDERALIGVSRGLLLWGPLCVLAVWAPAVQMAQYAVAARTALIVDFFLPALSLAAHQNVLPAAFIARPGCSRRKLLMRQLGAALLYSSAIVVALLIAAPATLAAYGAPYTSLLTVYALLLGVQWVNGVGDPAVRDAVVDWDARRIQLSVGSGALAAVLVCAFGVAGYGALAAATGALAGAIIVNARAIAGALERSRQSAVSV